LHELNNSAMQDKIMIKFFFMILIFKSFTFNIDTNIHKYNSNTINNEILTFNYKKRDSN
jgi:hypothetical protein